MANMEWSQENKNVARNTLSKAGLSDAQIEGGALEAALDIAYSSGLDVADAAATAARAVLLLSRDAEKSVDPDQDLAQERERARGMSAEFFSDRRTPRIQVLALPPERVSDAEANPFILVFDRIRRDGDLYDDLLAAREGLEIGTGARAVMIFADEVDVVTGFEVDDELVAKIRAVIERRSA